MTLNFKTHEYQYISRLSVETSVLMMRSHLFSSKWAAIFCTVFDISPKLTHLEWQCLVNTVRGIFVHGEILSLSFLVSYFFDKVIGSGKRYNDFPWFTKTIKDWCPDSLIPDPGCFLSPQFTLPEQMSSNPRKESHHHGGRKNTALKLFHVLKKEKTIQNKIK